MNHWVGMEEFDAVIAAFARMFSCTVFGQSLLD